jgi:DNA-directed RNA polymerase alpha subunit
VDQNRIREKNTYKEEPIELCHFSNRTYLALKRNGINDIFTLIRKFNRGEISKTRGIGRVSFSEIEEYMMRNYPEILTIDKESIHAS